MNIHDAVEKRVLVIDDSEDMRVLLTILLESKGYHAEFSSNGREALRMLNSATELPDMILVDLQMPVMDGYSFIACQRRIPKLQKIPVIVMSGDDADLASRAKLNRLSVLRKPISIKSLMDVLERQWKLCH